MGEGSRVGERENGGEKGFVRRRKRWLQMQIGLLTPNLASETKHGLSFFRAVRISDHLCVSHYKTKLVQCFAGGSKVRIKAQQATEMLQKVETFFRVIHHLCCSRKPRGSHGTCDRAGVRAATRNFQSLGDHFHPRYPGEHCTPTPKGVAPHRALLGRWSGSRPPHRPPTAPAAGAERWSVKRHVQARPRGASPFRNALPWTPPALALSAWPGTHGRAPSSRQKTPEASSAAAAGGNGDSSSPHQPVTARTAALPGQRRLTPAPPSCAFPQVPACPRPAPWSLVWSVRRRSETPRLPPPDGSRLENWKKSKTWRLACCHDD